MDISSLPIADYSALLTKLLQTILIIVLSLIAMKATSVFVRRFENRLIRSGTDSQVAARYKTFLTTGTYVVNIVIVFIAVLMILIVFGIDIAPLLASVGVASLAISLGAQTLIKDYIGGILILLEDQFRVGDVVVFGNGLSIGDITGTVDQITLRSTSIRDVEGRLIIVPNGDIRVISRVAYDWMRVVVDFNVPFDADIGKVVDVLKAAMEKAAADAEIADQLLETPSIQGWNSFSPWAVQVRLMAKTQPEKRLEVATVLRRHGLEALKQAGLQVAVPLPESLAGA
jgi:small conductance mechanosensitive channel